MGNKDFIHFINFGGDVHMLNRCVNSVIDEAEALSTKRPAVCILNDTLQPVLSQLDNGHRCGEKIPPVELVIAQMANWFIKLSYENGQDFALYSHTDAEMMPGALANMLEKWEEVKDTKWGVIMPPSHEAGDSLALYNPHFFVRENVWFDPFLFPLYYGDNHIYRIMLLRGYSIIHSSQCLVRHKISHVIKSDPVMRRRNEVAFGPHGQIYQNIWGGLPGHDTVHDIYANGTTRRPS